MSNDVEIPQRLEQLPIPLSAADGVWVGLKSQETKLFRGSGVICAATCPSGGRELRTMRWTQEDQVRLA